MQPSLFDTAPPFQGATFDPAWDEPRLRRLLDRVRTLMADGRYRTLAEIVAVTGGTEASVSARLRDLRRGCHGGHVVDRRPRGERKRGLFEYALVS